MGNNCRLTYTVKEHILSGMKNETLGQRLQRLRLDAGLTQAQLADAAGTPLSSLQNWEIDRREPGLRAAVRFARTLGVTVEDLADTSPVEEVGKIHRPAGPSRRDGRGRVRWRSQKDAPAATTEPAPKKGKGKK